MVGVKARGYEAGFQDRCTLSFSRLVIDELQHIVLREGRKVELTGTEFDVLNLLARHLCIVYGREPTCSSAAITIGRSNMYN